MHGSLKSWGWEGTKKSCVLPSNPIFIHAFIHAFIHSFIHSSKACMKYPLCASHWRYEDGLNLLQKLSSISCLNAATVFLQGCHGGVKEEVDHPPPECLHRRTAITSQGGLNFCKYFQGWRTCHLPVSIFKKKKCSSLVIVSVQTLVLLFQALETFPLSLHFFQVTGMAARNALSPDQTAPGTYPTPNSE